jgi:diacylglycerol kinase family enzyme
MLAIRAMAGRIVRGRDLDQMHATSLIVESHHARAEVARDGEVGTLDTPLRYRIRPRALRVIAPMAGGST